jgi:holo-[acyl-carrier protein] synthase
MNIMAKSRKNVPSVPNIPDNAGSVIGLGIDIVARHRVERMLKSHGSRFLKRCFTKDEADYCMTRPDPIPDLAVRLAAKEAGFKAIGARRGMGIGWRDFETVMDNESVPFLRLHGKGKDKGEKDGIGKIWMSLTHEDDWAVAVVILTKKS